MPDFKSHTEINFCHWEQHNNVWHFPSIWLPDFKQAVQCSDSVYVPYHHKLYIQTVPVDEKGLCPFTNGGHWAWYVQMSQCDWWPEANLLWRKTSTWKDYTTYKEKWPQTLLLKQICKCVNFAHRMSTSVNWFKCQGHMTFLGARGMWHFISARGMNICL